MEWPVEVCRGEERRDRALQEEFVVRKPNMAEVKLMKGGVKG